LRRADRQQRAGLEPGDVIVQFNSKPVKDRDSLVSMVVSTAPNTTVPVKVIRTGREDAERQGRRARP
jgi:S1-C subfamily serine protease